MEDSCNFHLFPSYMKTIKRRFNTVFCDKQETSMNVQSSVFWILKHIVGDLIFQLMYKYYAYCFKRGKDNNNLVCSVCLFGFASLVEYDETEIQVPDEHFLQYAFTFHLSFPFFRNMMKSVFTSCNLCVAGKRCPSDNPSILWLIKTAILKHESLILNSVSFLGKHEIVCAMPHLYRENCVSVFYICLNLCVFMKLLEKLVGSMLACL